MLVGEKYSQTYKGMRNTMKEEYVLIFKGNDMAKS